jgi:CMP-N-acetylneuraminic acid synthetase
MIVSENGEKKMVLGRIKSWFKKPKLILSGVPISQRITRRQEFPEAWIPTGSIYLFKTSNLKKGSIYGDNIMLMETESEININSLEDWNKAEELCKEL